MRDLRPLLPIAVLAATFPFLGGADCLGLCDYETDASCEDPTRAQVSGTITVPEAGGDAFGMHRMDPRLAVRLKHEVSAALHAQSSSSSTAQQSLVVGGPGATGVGGAGVVARVPQQSHNNRVAAARLKTERFRNGEIIVRALEPMRERKAEFAAMVRGYLDDHFERGLSVDVRLCGTDYRCLAEVRDARGDKIDLESTAEAALALSRAPFLKYAEKNLILQMAIVPNDEFFTLQWHYAAIDLPTAWDTTIGDPSLVAAIVDTGILVDHPDLRDRVLGNGADLIDDPSVANDGDGRDNDGDDPGDNECGQGCNSYHGSHVAGTIGASTDNGTMVSGITWEGGLLPVRVLGNGGGSLSDIADGIEWAVGHHVDGVNDNDNPADVMNMSLGGEGHSAAMDEAVADAVAEGCIVLVAAGNSDEDATNSTPANSPDAIVVASHGNTGPSRQTPRRASYSNFGNKVDIAAPGGEQAEDVDGDGQGDGVLSTIDDFVAYYQGTSMATPHVAGVSMLLKSLEPSLTQEDVRDILTQSASPDLDCPEGCGAGRMSAAAAILELQGGLDGARVIASPAFLRVGKGQTETPVVFKNLGNSAASVTLSVGGENRDACSLDDNGGNVGAKDQLVATLTIQRNDAADDSGACTVTASFDGGSSEAQVQWSDAAVVPLTSVTVGPVQILDNGDLKVIAERITSTTELEGFKYKLFNLDPGTYIIVGLVDTNNDGDFDDDVDAVGIFEGASADGSACGDASVDCGFVTLKEGDHLNKADFLVAPGFDPGNGGGGGGTGDTGLGGACASSDECAGGLYCELVLPGGYCTTDCQSDVDCPTDGACFQIADDGGQTYSVCLKSCTDAAECGRTDNGYTCDGDNTCFPG